MDMRERLETEETWVTHRGAGVRVDIEVTSGVIGAQTVWGAEAVLERGRRVKLRGGQLPAGAKQGHRAMLQAAMAQAQALPTDIILGRNGQVDLFGR